jgi:predicted transcriptional regulator
MPTLSVKLPEETRQRIQSVAQTQGITAHAVMVNAIESALAAAEHRNALVATALRAREQVLASGKVVDGKAFGDYLRARVRGQTARRPRPVGLKSIVSSGQ